MRLLLILLLLSSYLIGFGQSDEDCIFDRSTQTDEFVKNIPEFENYTWNNKTKTATIILDDGDSLMASRGGCVHFGISGKLITSDKSKDLNNLDYWLNKSKWIGERLFDQTTMKELTTALEKGDYIIQKESDRVYLNINHDSYNEFYIVVFKNELTYSVEIGYWF